jgi:hypothetical protein
MKAKPKEIMVNLPAVHLFATEDEISATAAAINTIIHGKVKIKCETIGILGGQFVGLFYIQRNNESQEMREEFVQLIEQEEISNVSLEERFTLPAVEDDDDPFSNEPTDEETYKVPRKRHKVKKLLTKEQMENLTTARLLAYKNSLMEVPETPNWDEPGYQLNKTSQEWKDTYYTLKDILATREHVERK